MFRIFCFRYSSVEIDGCLVLKGDLAQPVRRILYNLSKREFLDARATMSELVFPDEFQLHIALLTLVAYDLAAFNVDDCDAWGSR